MPFAKRAFDCAYSYNLLECLREPAALIVELARVVRPAAPSSSPTGLGHAADGSDRVLLRRLVQGYADRRQAWMACVDPWLGRRIWDSATLAVRSAARSARSRAPA